MSGVEAITIAGLIGSIITIINTSRELYDTAHNAQGLHEAFRAVSQNIPLVLDILRKCKAIQERNDERYKATKDAELKRELKNSAEAVRPIMTTCKENVQRLNDIFDKVIPGDDAGRLERYRKATQAAVSGKKRKVEDLMKDILQKLQLLHTSQFFGDETKKWSDSIRDAIARLEELPSSLGEEDGRYTHYGSGSMNINSGKGTQHNYSQSGGSNNHQNITHSSSPGKGKT
ncbi:hypothetical protein C1H76_4678 [Elsinoe australis]|uniref:NACHT-NTPase and P-loop NTPases N-terminal domain-containing protein n=1 Tax=Elsinoe australis TaxID=40998 RepID=A0A4U7B247_9PEZI|nr:hypothetical protein C1H76_4678 [Elsinoe australis]